MKRLAQAFAGAIALVFTGLAVADTGLLPGSPGMIATNQPLAAMAGMNILAAGGNAIDAAISAAAVLGVSEPYLSGLGGDGFMIVYWAETGDVQVLDFSGQAPAAVADVLLEEGSIPVDGPASAVVPGAAAGWEAARERYATLELAELLQPAIELAESGFPATAYAADAMSWAAGLFYEWDEIGALTWWNGELAPPGAGELILNERLAATYRKLAQDGLMSFYDGEVSRELLAAVNEHGGVISAEDFRSFSVGWSEPLHINYRGYDLFSPRLNSTGGLATMQIMKILEGFDVASWESQPGTYLHVLIEAVKLAAMDRVRWGGDPDFLAEPIPYERLLSDDYAAELREKIDMEHIAAARPVGGEQPGTSHISVVDAAGNRVALTMSIGSGWGSGFVAGETGIVLNNSLSLFNSDGDSAAYLEPRKRVPWNMAPMLVFREDLPWLALGTPGGTGIWQTMPQVLTRLIDFGQTLEEAIEAPRFRWLLSGDTVGIEDRFGDEVSAELASRGHQVRDYGSWSIAAGAVNGVERVTDHPPAGAVDPRREGFVVGW
jgi:gamma-glutamyltranspeptidase/glutathione hydrolase